MKKIYNIKGMHCRSCELRIEEEVRKVPGVKTAHASTKKGVLLVISDIDLSADIYSAVKAAGYEIGTKEIPLINKSPSGYLDLIPGIIILGFLLLLFRNTNLASFLNPTSFASSSLAAFFTIGLTAGVSSCMALVGGLVLGISARHSEKHPNATALERFRPHIFFNIGRLISFFVLGGLLGEVGSFITISGPALGFMVIIVGLVMFFLGIQLTEIFPRFTAITLPKFLSGFSSRKDKEYSHLNSTILGALTFFLPCGFTQAAQIYAVSTGSFWRGGILMLFFALGTAPGLLGIGGLTSSIKKGKFSKIFFKTIGIAIILLSAYNLKNGLNLMGVNFERVKEPAIEETTPQIWGPKTEDVKTDNPGPVSTDSVQVLKSVYNPSDEGTQYVIEPRDFSVKVDKPVRLEVLAKRDGLGCMGSITIPRLVNDFKIFTKDETAVFEFTPKKTGTYKITCGMGIPMGTIKVTN